MSDIFTSYCTYVNPYALILVTTNHWVVSYWIIMPPCFRSSSISCRLMDYVYSIQNVDSPTLKTFLQLSLLYFLLFIVWNKNRLQYDHILQRAMFLKIPKLSFLGRLSIWFILLPYYFCITKMYTFQYLYLIFVML